MEIPNEFIRAATKRAEGIKEKVRDNESSRKRLVEILDVDCIDKKWLKSLSYWKASGFIKFKMCS